MRKLALALLLGTVLAGSAGARPATLKTRDPVWSPDGTRLAYVRTSGSVGRVFVVGFDGRDRRAIGPGLRSPYGLAWSPNGRSLAFASGGDIWRVDLGGRARRLTSEPAQGASHPAWSPDGKTIAYAVFEGCFRCTRIYGLDLASGRRRLLADGPRRPTWGRSSPLLLTSHPVTLVDVTTGQARSVDDGSFASWSAKGPTFAYTGAQGVYVSDPTRASPQLVWPMRGQLAAFPVLSPSGVRLAAVQGRRVVLRNTLGGPIKTLPRSDSANDAPAWSFHGRLAFVADGPCGRQSEIDVVRSDGSRPHALVRSCPA